jgi:hypothetical protein
MIAVASDSVACTMTGDSEFGSTWLNTMRLRRTPSALAAVT